MIEVQKIACSNHGAFIMSFVAKGGGSSSDSSGDYLVNEVRVVDLATSSIPEGTVISIEVSAVAGDTVTSADRVVYRKNGQTATWRASGTTLDFGVELVGAPSSAVLAGFPAGIPVGQYDFVNWARDIEVPDVWTCAPRTQQEVADVCNWAAENGFHVRARGVMHGWSPLAMRAVDRNILFVDLTKYLCELEFLPAGDGKPARVRAGAGAVMIDLLTFLEQQPGGGGAASGWSFPHTPAPGNLTVGGVLAINAHGTALRTLPFEDQPTGYGSMSNRIVELTAIVTDEDAGDPDVYRVETFRRGDPNVKAFLTHLGRALVVEVVLEVIPNYNLRCRSRTDLDAKTLFAPPNGPTPDPNSFAAFVDACARVEVIWFPFTDRPWLHLWKIEPQRPAASRHVTGPYNYPFADNLDPEVQKILDDALASGALGITTPIFGKAMFKATDHGLDGKNFLGAPTYPVSRDIWGASKNVLLYIEDSTLRVTANGYAIHMKRSDLQLAVFDFVTEYQRLIRAYEGRLEFPVNQPVEIRVTGLDDPDDLSPVPPGTAESPILSSTTLDPVAKQNGWDVALWLDVLTLPKTPKSDQFYEELENWLRQRFVGTAGRVMPEWSKGWGYSAVLGAWSNEAFLGRVRKDYTDGRPAGATWNAALDTFAKYDRREIFWNNFLRGLLVRV